MREPAYTMRTDTADYWKMEGMREMSSMRENFLRAARCQSPEYVPFDGGMSRGFYKKFEAYAGVGADVCETLRYDNRWISILPTRRPAPDWRAMYYTDGRLPDNATVDPEWGTGALFFAESDDQQNYFPLENLTDAADAEAYPWPDCGAAYRFEGLSERVRAYHDRGLSVHIAAVPSFFEQVWGLRGFAQCMMDMASDDPFSRVLFEKIHRTSVECAVLAARTGADVLQVGSDIATQHGLLMSKEMWREYLMPILRDVIQGAKSENPEMLVRYHSCGNVSSLLEELIELGVDILDPCQPEAMDLFELKRRYGRDICFHGGIGVQSVLPHGTVQEVRDCVRRTIDVMGEGGGYICAPSHNVCKEVPLENYMAFVETVREYGHP